LNSYISDIDKNTLRIAIPLILANITIPLVGFVDNVAMGQLGSAIYIGAVGLGAIIISFILFSFGFIKSITASFTSQHTGENKRKTLLISLYQILIISSSISLAIILFREQIIHTALSYMGGSAEVKANTKIYLDYRIWSVPAIFLRDILIGYYIGIQKTRIAMIISIFINILNALLDYYFIFILHFGIEGVAIASIISEYSIFLFIIFAIKTEELISKNNISLNTIFYWNTFKKKIFINFDMFIRSFILMTCFAYFMSMGAQYGNLILAANTILLNFFFIFSYGIDGFAHASEVLVANYLGEKNLKLIKKSIISTGKLSFILMILYLVFFLIFDQRIIGFITTIESVQIIAIDNSIWLYLIFLSATIAFWLDGVFIGILKIKLLRNTMIIAAIIFFVLETIIIGGNNTGLWLSFLGFFMVRSLLLGLYLIKYMRKDRFLV